MGCIITEDELEIDKLNDKKIKSEKKSNSFNLDRLGYFSHLLGGLQSVLYSRFLAGRPRPFTLSHMVTNECNCDCDFCFWKYHKKNDELTLPEIQKIYAQAKKEGFMNSVLWGGEPLLRQDFTEIAKASHDNGMYTKMATNGWFLQENHEFGRYTDLIFVSIDHIGRKHDIIRGNRFGLFDRAVSGIEFMKKTYPKMRIYICCTVSTVNDENSIAEVAKLCKDLDILLYFTVNKSNQDFSDWEGKDKLKGLEKDLDQLSTVFKEIKGLKKQGYPIRNSDYFMDYIIEKKNYYECHWPKVGLVFYSNGDVLRCYDRKPILNLREMSLGEAIRSPEYISMAEASKKCDLACLGNYSLDASGIWKFDPKAIQSIAKIAIT